MVISFECRETEWLFRRGRTKRFPPEVHVVFLRRLFRAGQHSIRINRQWRVCFTWRADGARDVEIVDYH